MKLCSVASSGFFLVFELGSDFLCVMSCAPKAISLRNVNVFSLC